MRADFRSWLEPQYDADVVDALIGRSAKVEKHYGDLDRQYDADRLDGLLGSLRYTPQDERRRKPNPTRIPFEGNIRSNINAFRAAIDQYRRYRAEAAGAPRTEPAPAPPPIVGSPGGDEDPGQKINLERDLQASLRQAIDRLEPGLAIIDGGAPRQVESGPIDITARDAAGATVVILLKSGGAGLRAVAQILNFMGDVRAESPQTSVRGILLAASFDRKGRSVARMAPALSLRRYEIDFRILAPEE